MCSILCCSVLPREIVMHNILYRRTKNTRKASDVAENLQLYRVVRFLHPRLSQEMTHISAVVQRITLNALCMTILGGRTKQLDIFCHFTGFTSDFLSFISVFGSFTEPFNWSWGHQIWCTGWLLRYPDRAMIMNSDSQRLRSWGTGVRGLARGLATLSQGYQEPLMVNEKVGRPQVTLGWEDLWNVILLLQCFDTVGWATGRAPGL